MERDYKVGFKVVRVPRRGPYKGALLSAYEERGAVRYYTRQWVMPRQETHAAKANGPLTLFATPEQAREFMLRYNLPGDTWNDYRIYRAHYRPATRTFRGLKVWTFRPVGPVDYDPEYSGCSRIGDFLLADAVRLVERLPLREGESPCNKGSR